MSNEEDLGAVGSSRGEPVCDCLTDLSGNPMPAEFTRKRKNSIQWMSFYASSASAASKATAAASVEDGAAQSESTVERPEPTGCIVPSTGSELQGSTAESGTHASLPSAAPQQTRNRLKSQRETRKARKVSANLHNASSTVANVSAPLDPEFIDYCEFLRIRGNPDQADELLMFAVSCMDSQVKWRHDRFGCCVLRITCQETSTEQAPYIQITVKLPLLYPAENHIAEVQVVGFSMSPSFAFMVSEEVTSFATVYGESGAPLLMPIVGHVTSVLSGSPPSETASTFGSCQACNKKMRAANMQAVPQPAYVNEQGQWICVECGGQTDHIARLGYMNTFTGKLHETEHPAIEDDERTSVWNNLKLSTDSITPETFLCNYCLCDDVRLISLDCGCWSCFSCFIRMAEIAIGSKQLVSTEVSMYTMLPSPSRNLPLFYLRQRSPLSKPALKSIAAAAAEDDTRSIAMLTNTSVTIVGVPCPIHYHPEAPPAPPAAPAAPPPPEPEVAPEAAPLPENPLVAHPGENGDGVVQREEEQQPEQNEPPPQVVEKPIESQFVRIAGGIRLVGRAAERPKKVTPTTTKQRQKNRSFVFYDESLLRLLSPRYYEMFNFFAMEEALKNVKFAITCPLPRCRSFPFISEHYGTHPLCPFCKQFFCLECSEPADNCVCESDGKIDLVHNIFEQRGFENLLPTRTSHNEYPRPPHRDVETVTVSLVHAFISDSLELPLDGDWYVYVQDYCATVFARSDRSTRYLYWQVDACLCISQGVILNPKYSLRDQYVHSGSIMFVLNVYTTVAAAMGDASICLRSRKLRVRIETEEVGIKKCPVCSRSVVHYLGHGCHIIYGCHGYGREWCYVCMAESKNHSCPNKCPLFCDYTVKRTPDANGRTVLDVVRGKCSCPLCASCKLMRPCEQCTGCPVCKPPQEMLQ